MRFILTAQPMHDDGSVDFDHSVTKRSDSLSELFMRMANTLIDYNHTQMCGAWDLTLEVRES